MLLVVYGTLREGEALASVLEFVRRKSTIEIITLPIELYVVGQCPGAKFPAPKKKGMLEPREATVELWDIPISKKEEGMLLDFLDKVEGVDSHLYNRVTTVTPKGIAWIYLYGPGVHGCYRVYDWKEFQALSDAEKKKATNSMRRSSGYVITSTKHTSYNK
jgi:gamma-glutamylcyclotransferase (GGCT)/AIG2-like uncharacterized protein YtfP